MNKIFEGLENKKVLILGFAEEGKSTYQIIRSEFPQKEIFIADRKTQEEFLKDLSADVKNDKHLKFILGESYLSKINGFNMIIKTPGIPPIDRSFTSQTQIFFNECKGKIIGVTGTKGKSTTATLIYEILKKSGLKIFLIGNIGKPALDILKKENNEDTFYVYELSSHQLFKLTKSPHVSVILNIGSDHLDWHGSQEAYVTAKKNIILHQKTSDYAILNEKNEVVKNLVNETKAEILFFSGDALASKYKDKILLKGKHNWDNVAAAVKVAEIFKIKDEIISFVLQSFKGLPHRLEVVGEHGGVMFINDSISTNPVSLLAAIDSFSEDITLMMGGYERGIDYRDIAKAISDSKNIKNILLIGQTSKRMEADLKEAGYSGNLLNCGTEEMKSLVNKAFEMTQKGGIVLLSPAAASFDMFKDYKERGEKFREAAQNLK